MSKIKKIWGLVAIGTLAVSAFLGMGIRENKPGVESKSTEKERSYITTVNQETEVTNKITVAQPRYLCVADLLEVDENTRALAMYENLEIVECMTVGCGGFF